MSKSFTLISVLCLFLFSSQGQAQSIWPGDINNNGVVNCADLLYWGVAYSKSGTARSNVSTSWQAQNMPTAWSWSFPGGGMNYAYADANGDGTVDKKDADNAIQTNFFKTHGNQTNDKFSEISNAALTKLNVKTNTAQVNSGGTVTVEVSLTGDRTIPSGHFQGIAIIIGYNPSFVDANSFSFQRSNTFDPSGSYSYMLAKNNANQGEVEIGLANLPRGEENTLGDGLGILGQFSFKIADVSGNKNLNFQVKNVGYIDSDMKYYPINVGNEANIVIVGGNNGGGCPNVINPVCGSDGKVYLNSCYAEAAGVTDYTPGVCNPDCVDPSRINPDKVCPAVYEPVCGCNGVTYANACEADAAGVVSWRNGPCSQNINDCYDPNLIVSSSATTVDDVTGVITINCPDEYDPVCACNGVTYPNACTAEANGVKFYTKGVCNAACVNSDSMNPSAICTLEYNPVCGCNGVTYGNACIAEAAGVVSYTPGVCGATSAWCAKAVPISCGDFLSNESTTNAGNNISQYPCSTKAYPGPEKVYVINKTSAGDLQIGLEILTANLDLDMFLLAPNCNQVTCLKKSTTNNTQTNNEGIIYEDAPIGTYYLVVDGSAAGQYRLELSCGYLDCSDAVQLACGQTYNGNNANGNDNVSLYGCSGNVLNVENNGPEMVHYFTVTEAGNVTISLTGLSANLELFLLSACDRGSCLEFSQNSGTANESITAYLTPGTYYVVVDGYNGATSNYKLKVDCTASCNLSLNLEAYNANCGQSNGSIHVALSGGSPQYYIALNGPVSGSYSTQSNSSTINGLPAGIYKVCVTDHLGCSVTKEVTVNSSGGLSIQTVVTDASCGQSGKIKVTLSNGTPAYKIYVSGAETGNFISNSSSFTLSELIGGTYNLYIIDANGCSVSTTVNVGHSGSSFYFTATPNPSACESPGSISVKTFNGTAPYSIKVTGPKSGTATSNSSMFNIVNLTPGTYTVTIEDANWCSYTLTVTVTTTELAFTLLTQEGTCDQAGAVKVNITSGKPTFMISWSGPTSGSVSTNSTSYTLPNLPPGTYTVTVKDANWCEVSKTIEINNTALDIQLHPENGACEANGTIGLDVLGGKKPYTLTWTGPTTGEVYLNTNWYGIENLPAGNYTVKIVDANGCVATDTTHIIIADNNLSINASLTSGSCGSNNTIVVDIFGGKPDYTVMWNGPVSGQATTGNTTFEIQNLPPGSYSIQVKDPNWCMAFKSVTIEPSLTNIFTATVTNGICETPGSIKLTFTGGMPDYKITWSGPVSGSAITSGNMYAISSLPAGSYTVTVKDSKGCIDTKTIQVVTTEGSLSVHASLIVNQCGQYTTIWVDVTGGSTPYIITWSGPVNGSTTTSNQGYEIKDVPPGKYTITVTDANWCSVSTMIMVFDTPANLFTATPKNVICEGSGSIKLNFIGGMAPYHVSWNGAVSDTVIVNDTMYQIQDLPPGAYVINIKDKNNCTDRDTVHVSVAESSLAITATQSSTACGPNGKIKVTISGGAPTYTIAWSGPVNGSVFTNGSMYEISDLPPGTYTVSVKDSNWCYVSKTVALQNTPADFFTAIPTPRICETLGSIKINFTGGSPVYHIRWTGPSPGSASTSQNMFVIQNLAEGVYTISVTDGNGCTTAKTVEVLFEEGGIAVETALIVNDCGQYNTIWVDITGGMPTYTVVWEGPANGTQTTANQGFEIKDLPPGKYTITVKDKNWCYATVMDTVFNTPINIFSATPNNGACNQEGSIDLTLTGTPNYTIAWSGQESGNASVMTNSFNIPNLSAGNYSITVTDSKGCVEIENLALTGGSGNLAATITGVNGDQSELGKIQVDITAGAAPFTIDLSGSSTASIAANGTGLIEISNLPGGQYTVKVTDDNGCTVSSDVTISITENVVSFTASQTGNTCSTTGAILLSISGGSPNYTVSWSGGGITGSASTNVNSFTIQNLPTGTYTVTVASQNGSSASKNVQVFANPSALSISASVTNGTCGQNGQLLININNGTSPFTINWSGPTSGSTSINGSFYNITNLPSGTYNVQVTENGGCSQSKTMSVTNTNQQPVANFAYSVNGTSVTFINQSSPGSYSWAFGDNASSGNSNPSHVYGNNSSYQACLTVTNSCGSQSICKTITIGTPENSALIDVQDLAGATGSTIYVPVVIQNCVTGSLVSFAGSLNISNPAVATITGIVPGSMSPQYNANNKTFSYFNNSGNGIPCGAGQILFYVAIQITGSQGASAVLTITGSPLAIELGGMNNGTPTSVPYSISSGIVMVSNTAKVSGEVSTYWGVGLPNVDVTIAHAENRQTKTTDQNGHYELSGMPMGESYTVQPKHNANSENGLSTYALFAGQRFILGMQPQEIVSPYQIIAGDANCDGQFTTLDLFLIQRIIIGASQNFGDCPSWVFVKANQQMPLEFTATNVFPYLNYDTLMLMKDTVSDFIGVKVGDILGHANPIAAFGASPRSNGKLKLVAINRALSAGDVIEIPVTSDNFNEIASYQMGLSFDTQQLAFVDMIQSSNPYLAKVALGDGDAKNGALRLSWFDLRGTGVTVQPDEVLFTLRFRVLQNISDLSKVLTANSRYLRAEAYTTDAKPLEVELNVEGQAILQTGATPTVPYKLYQNMPNPFSQQTYIGFDLPVDMPAELLIFDQLGKVVRQYKGDFTHGYNRIEVPKEMLGAGVYYYTLRTGDFADTKSMIILE